jgi:hypothetical protein
VCPGCGYRYPDGQTCCPTLATVRPVLRRRRRECPDAVARLTPIQFADLHRTTTRTQRATVRQAAPISPSPNRAPSLFDLTGKDSAR